MIGNPLIFIHAGIAELGLMAYLWVLVECLDPSGPRVRRARTVAAIGLICLLVAWVAGGTYYISVYGAEIKPAIVASDVAWIHGIVLEVKEHVFLFLPVLAIVTTSLLFAHSEDIIENDTARKAVVTLSGLIFLLGFALAGMGVLIAAGYRFALEAGVA